MDLLQEEAMDEENIPIKVDGKAGASKMAMALPAEYARLELQAPVQVNGAEFKEIVIYRPTCGILSEVFNRPKTVNQVEHLIDGCCRATNGSGEAERFSGRELCVFDSNEVVGVLGEMSAEADEVISGLNASDTGDGVTSPIVYTLLSPIKMSQADDAETVHQFAFEARKVGDIADFLDAQGERQLFYTFMRTFGKPLGLRIPIMTDALINAMDFLDYLVIRRNILGKFITSRKRWKKVSSLAH